MKKFINLIALIAIIFISASAFAQNAKPFKGNYSGVLNGRECTLDMNLYDNTIDAFGILTADPKTQQIKKLKEPSDIKCLGTLDIYDGAGYVTYNILTFEDEPELGCAFMMINGYDDDESEFIMVDISTKDGGKTIKISDTRDIDDPLFENLTLKRVN